MTGAAGTSAAGEAGPLPAGVRVGLERAVRGMLRLARVEPDPEARARLAYLAVAVGGYGDGPVPPDGAGDPGAWAGELQPYRDLEWAVLDPAFVQRLRQAAPEPMTSPGWTVTARESRRTLLTRDGIRAWAPAGAVEPPRGYPGTLARVRVPSLSVGISPGFVVRRPPLPVPRPWSRIYLNVTAEQAPWCLGPLADALSRALPVLLKVPAHPRSYLRRDAAVLYVATDQLPRALDRTLDALETHGIALETGAPLLTRAVAQGVGVADDPSERGEDPVSHGRWAARLLLDAADGDPGPHASGEGPHTRPLLDREAALLDRVVQGIRDTGRDPAHPHLRPGRTPLALPTT